MGKLKIRFHPLFIIYVFLCVYWGWFNNVFYYVIAVVVHEYGHYFVASRLGYRTDGILFSIYGAGLYTSKIYKSKDDIKISLAGPFVNLIIIILIVCFWWIVPSSYLFTYDFFLANSVVMIFNLIPIYPLDGGRVLVAVLADKFKRKRVMKVSNIICFIIGVFFLVIFLISFAFKVNINSLFLGLFLCLNSIAGDRGDFFEKAKAFNKGQNTLHEVKVFKAVNVDRLEMLKNISPNYYSIFLIKENGQDKVINEDEILGG